MSVTNLSEMLTTVKENCELGGLPLPVTDNQIIDRIHRKSLRDFSIMYPRVEHCYIGDEQLADKSRISKNGYTEYIIPKWVYAGTEILEVLDFNTARPNGYSDFFIPNANWSTPDAVIAAMADVRMAAGVASSLAKAPTTDFKAPNRLRVFNGWAGGLYEVELALRHDDSLATVPPGALISLEELITLDVKAYLYGKLKRSDNLETGVGTSQLNINSWESAAQEYKDLIKQWDDDGANLSFSHIERW